MNRCHRLIGATSTLLGCIWLVPTDLSAADINLDIATTHQTVRRGWEITCTWPLSEFPAYRQYAPDWIGPVMSHLADVGVNRIRLEVRVGAENPTDWWQLYDSGAISSAEWRAHRYETINDNANAGVENASGFCWSELDHNVVLTVQPLQAALAARGESLHVSLCVVDFGIQTGADPDSDTEFQNQPDEYAEFLLAAVRHLDTTYGIVPDSIETMLEPDNAEMAGWTAQQVADCMVAAGDRLQSAGYTPGFIAPSVVNSARCLPWLDVIRSTPGANSYLSEVYWHPYKGGIGNAAAIGDSAASLGLGVSMSEWWSWQHDYRDLHFGLKHGHTGWQIGVPTFKDASRPNNPVRLNPDQGASASIELTEGGKQFGQYFRHIRPEAVRYEASSDAASADPVAFRNADGKHALVVVVDAPQVLRISGLPAGTYHAEYTPEPVGTGAYAIPLPDQVTDGTHPVVFDMPVVGIITIFGDRVVGGPVNPPIVPTTDMIAWWPLDDLGGMAVDATGNGSDGQLFGGPIWDGGVYAGALRFAGGGDHVEVINESAFDVDGSFSIAMWFKRDDLIANNMCLVGKPIDGKFYLPSFSLRFDSADRFGLVYCDTDGKWTGIVDANPIRDLSWHHVAAVFDTEADLVTIYLDGAVFIERSLRSRMPMNGDDPLYLGSGAAGKAAFRGYLDDVRFYGRALDSDGVLELSIPRSNG